MYRIGVILNSILYIKTLANKSACRAPAKLVAVSPNFPTNSHHTGFLTSIKSEGRFIGSSCVHFSRFDDDDFSLGCINKPNIIR